MPNPTPQEITRLLGELRKGRTEAADRLFALVYPELRRIAAAKIRRERPGISLQATDLVNEAYLRLIAQVSSEWNDRVHFYAMAANFMRRILVDRARKRLARRHIQMSTRQLAEEPGLVPEDPEMMISLHNALDQLAELDERQARIVEMRFFGGMKEEEIAEVLNVSARTVKRDWKMARAWLAAELTV